MKSKMLLAICFLCCIDSIWAQNVKRPETYNYQRGLEAMQEEKIDEAIDFLIKIFKRIPKMDILILG